MIHTITLSDPTEDVSPPENVLQVCAVGDLAFISFGKYDETHDSNEITEKRQMTVSLPALKEAVELLSHDRDREAMRGERGTQHEADILGDRFRVAPL